MKRRVRYSTLTAANPLPDPTAEQLGNVTPVHRELLTRLTPAPDAAWSTRALWACPEELRDSVITAAAHVRVEKAWPDGPDAFCVVYAPPYQPDDRVGLRRHMDDDVATGYGLTSVLYHEHRRSSDPESKSDGPDPIAFGVEVAAFDIGEPLGHLFDRLRPDKDGVCWWGTPRPADFEHFVPI